MEFSVLVEIPLGTALFGRSEIDRRVKAIRRFKLLDQIFHALTLCASIAILVVLGSVFVSLGEGSLPAIKAFGFSFLSTSVWNPVTDKFGALAPVYGTLVTSFLAMLLAVPVGIGTAIFLSMLCPERLKQPIGIAVELLAGIPSIIYGLWGLFVFSPFLQMHFQPFMIDAFSDVPVLRGLFAGPPYGIGIFTASVILAIMILPFIASISRDVFETVPKVLKESAFAIGCTKWEVISNVILPYTRTGVAGGAMLALGRALGETMAVTFVIGNAHRISGSLFAPGTTISATIANEFTEAVGSLYTSSLIELGLVLFFITFVVLAIARLMLMRIETKAAV